MRTREREQREQVGGRLEIERVGGEGAVGGVETWEQLEIRQGVVEQYLHCVAYIRGCV